MNGLTNPYLGIRFLRHCSPHLHPYPSDFRAGREARCPQGAHRPELDRHPAEPRASRFLTLWPRIGGRPGPGPWRTPLDPGAGTCSTDARAPVAARPAGAPPRLQGGQGGAGAGGAGICSSGVAAARAPPPARECAKGAADPAPALPGQGFRTCLAQKGKLRPSERTQLAKDHVIEQWPSSLAQQV